jgi:hypothetical protein
MFDAKSAKAARLVDLWCLQQRIIDMCSVGKRGVREDEEAMHPVQGLDSAGTSGYVEK